MIVKVKCTLIVPVEIPDDENYDAIFDIEENHCPATGKVGIAIDKIIKEHDKNNTCWGCALEGKCEIID